MNKQQILELMAKVLSNNIDNRLTVELVNGLVAVVAHNLPNDPPKEEGEA